jgi:hypothetical protein
MSSSENERREGVDLDKLVTRLLDIIQQQQSELAKCRSVAEPTAQISAPPKIPERTPDMVQVSELKAFEPLPLAEMPQIQGPVDLRSAVRQNKIFLLLTGLMFIGTLIFAFKPKPPEISRLSAQLAKEEQALRDKDAEQQRMATAHNAEVVTLQQKLKDTEDALSQNEKALIEEQSALRQLTQSPSADPAAPPRKTPLVPVDQAKEAMESIARIRSDIIKTRADLFGARQAYIDNVRALAQNRLALYTVQVAEGAMDPTANHAIAEDKHWRDFVEPEAQPFVDAKPEDLPQYQLIGEPDSSSIENLRIFEKKALDVLRLCLADLRTFQDRILAEQEEVAATEARVHDEELKLLAMQNEPKHTFALPGDSKPSDSKTTPEKLNVNQH